MALTTASAVISLARQLETDSAAFYEALARRFPQGGETFQAFARENTKKNVVQVERAYYSVISDAIEGCFAFKMNEEDWVLDTSLSGDATFADGVAQAAAQERKIRDFYTTAAEQSQGLMADVPRAFLAVAKKHAARLEKIESLPGA